MRVSGKANEIVYSKVLPGEEFDLNIWTYSNVGNPRIVRRSRDGIVALDCQLSSASADPVSDPCVDLSSDRKSDTESDAGTSGRSVCEAYVDTVMNTAEFWNEINDG